MGILDRLIGASIGWVPRPIVGRVARRYVAGESLDEGIAAVRKLAQEGCTATYDLLGEFIDDISQGEVTVVADQHGRPTLVDDLVAGTLAALSSRASGVVHMANEGSTTWFDLAQTIASMAGLEPDHVVPCDTADYPTYDIDASAAMWTFFANNPMP